METRGASQVKEKLKNAVNDAVKFVAASQRDSVNAPCACKKI